MFFRTTKTLVLSLVLIFSFLSSVAPAFAQGVDQCPGVVGIQTSTPCESKWDEYKTLFTKGDTEKPIFGYGWLFDNETNKTKVTGIRFSFIAKFDLTKHTKKWYWDHVVSYNDDNDNGFIIRICSVGTDGQITTSCSYTPVSYLRGQNAATVEIARAINQDVFTTAIYRNIYDAPPGDLFLGVLQNDYRNKFGVNVALANTSLSPALTPGNRYQADFWYCPGNSETRNDATDPNTTENGPISPNIPTNDEHIKDFGPLCKGISDHRAYFRIGEPKTFIYPATIEDATNDTGVTAAATNEDNYSDRDGNDSILPKCHILNGWGPGTGSFVGCLAVLGYYMIYRPIQWFAGLMGNIFDFFLGYSISDEAYRMEFAVKGWQLIRDISNIFFIIILVWTGFATVFSIGNISMKQVVPALIVNALIINFSLFATRVAIDISNIFARVIYNSMSVVDNNKNTLSGPGGYKSLSAKIVSSFNPQNMFKTQYISPEQELVQNYDPKNDDDATAGGGAYDGGTFNSQSAGTDLENAKKLRRTDSAYAGYFIIVTLLAGTILFGVAKMFWKTAFLFLGRVMGLYITMIFAPFAFLTRKNMPLIGGIPQISWSSWIKDLTNYCLMAPVFMLFLYVVYLFVNSEFVQVFANKETDFFEAVIAIAVPMLIVYTLINFGVNIAKSFSGTVGQMIQNKVEGITGGIGGIAGTAVGVGAGALAFAGRNVLGRGMRSFGKSKTGRMIKDKDGNDVEETREMSWAANADSSKWARFMNYATNKSQTGSWDVRNLGVKIGKKEYTAGGTFNKGFGLLSQEKISDKLSDDLGVGKDKALGKGDKPGGILKLDEENKKARAEKLKNKIKYDHLSDEDAQKIWAEIRRKKIEQYGEAEWEKHVGSTDAMKFHKEKFETAEKELKEAKDALKKAQEEGKTSLAADQLKVKRAEENVEKIKKEKEQAEKQLIADIKLGKHGDRKKEAIEAAKKAEEERLDKYGNIKNKSGLEGAMRGEYAEDLRKNSLFMKDGKPRYWPGVLGTGIAATLAMVSPLGAVIGAAMFANMTKGMLRNLVGINTGATKKIIDEARKSQGRGSQEVQLTEKMEMLSNKLCEAVNSQLGTSFKKFEEMTLQQIEDGVIGKTTDLQKEIADLKFNKPAGWEKEVRKREVHIRTLENAVEDYERHQNNLERIQANKKKASEDKGKPKDSGGKDGGDNKGTK